MTPPRLAVAALIVLVTPLTACRELASLEIAHCEFGALPPHVPVLTLAEAHDDQRILSGRTIAVRGFYHLEYESSSLWRSQEASVSQRGWREPRIEVASIDGLDRFDGAHARSCRERDLIVFGEFIEDRMLGTPVIRASAVRLDQ